MAMTFTEFNPRPASPKCPNCKTHLPPVYCGKQGRQLIHKCVVCESILYMDSANVAR